MLKRVYLYVFDIFLSEIISESPTHLILEFNFAV